jgi:hypothetical protein
MSDFQTAVTAHPSPASHARLSKESNALQGGATPIAAHLPRWNTESSLTPKKEGNYMGKATMEAIR